MRTPKAIKPRALAEACFLVVEITHPRERQMHLIFRNGASLVISDDPQLPLAAALIDHFRKLERRHARRKGGRK